MAFFQTPPALGDQLASDPLLREWLSHRLAPEILAEERARLRHLGALAPELHRLQLTDRRSEPVHDPYDPWGHRVDAVSETAVWARARALTAEHGLVAAGYAGTYGASDRVVQFVRNYLVQASLDVYACPLAMTDGAARTLLDVAPADLVERAVPRLTSRDPDRAWTSGQWMTERPGGSDVGRSETEARPTDHPDRFLLHGTKWFTSAVGADMALTLARPPGNPAGGKGLALFYVELRDEEGRLQGIEVNRLKDKLGTRKVPTAELTLRGCPARSVRGTTDGTRHIASMLNVTRTWNAVSAAFLARRAVALALDYAPKRVAFGHRLAHQPLHRETLADLIAEQEAIFHLAFETVRLMGQVEHGASDEAKALLRILTPIAKLTTAKQAVAVASETLEAFGGAGYVEDTGLPLLLRDCQVLPIWEGTTNVLALDALRALRAPEVGGAALGWLTAELSTPTALEPARAELVRGVAAVRTWMTEAPRLECDRLEASARGFALTLGRTAQLRLMLEHAAAAKTPRAAAVVGRFAARGVVAPGAWARGGLDVDALLGPALERSGANGAP